MIIIETFLSCDGQCGTNFGVDARIYGARRQRADAKKNGWTLYKGKDYCPDCSKKSKDHLTKE